MVRHVRSRFDRKFRATPLFQFSIFLLSSMKEEYIRRAIRCDYLNEIPILTRYIFRFTRFNERSLPLEYFNSFVKRLCDRRNACLASISGGWVKISYFGCRSMRVVPYFFFHDDSDICLRFSSEIFISHRIYTIPLKNGLLLFPQR